MRPPPCSSSAQGKAPRSKTHLRRRNSPGGRALGGGHIQQTTPFLWPGGMISVDEVCVQVRVAGGSLGEGRENGRESLRERCVVVDGGGTHLVDFGTRRGRTCNGTSSNNFSNSVPKFSCSTKAPAENGVAHHADDRVALFPRRLQDAESLANTSTATQHKADVGVLAHR